MTETMGKGMDYFGTFSNMTYDLSVIAMTSRPQGAMRYQIIHYSPSSLSIKTIFHISYVLKCHWTLEYTSGIY